MDYVLALDVGGTGMKGALFGRDGAELHRAHRRTGRERGPEAVVGAVLRDDPDATRPPTVASTETEQ